MSDKPAIVRVGRVWDRSDGMTVIEGWHFDTRNLGPDHHPKTFADWARAYRDSDAGEPLPEDMWSIDELRDIAREDIELKALKTS